MAAGARCGVGEAVKPVPHPIYRTAAEEAEAARRVAIYAQRFLDLIEDIGLGAVILLTLPGASLFDAIEPTGDPDARHDPYEMCAECGAPMRWKKHGLQHGRPRNPVLECAKCDAAQKRRERAARRVTA